MLSSVLCQTVEIQRSRSSVKRAVLRSILGIDGLKQLSSVREPAIQVVLEQRVKIVCVITVESCIDHKGGRVDKLVRARNSAVGVATEQVAECVTWIKMAMHVSIDRITLALVRTGYWSIEWWSKSSWVGC